MNKLKIYYINIICIFSHYKLSLCCVHFIAIVIIMTILAILPIDWIYIIISNFNGELILLIIVGLAYMLEVLIFIVKTINKSKRKRNARNYFD